MGGGLESVVSSSSRTRAAVLSSSENPSKLLKEDGEVFCFFFLAEAVALVN